MRAWAAAHGLSTCGFCGVAIEAGAPVQVVELKGLPKRFRCEQHAQGPVDWAAVHASIGTSEPTDQPEPTFVRVGRVRSPFDPKMAAAGERDE